MAGKKVRHGTFLGEIRPADAKEKRCLRCGLVKPLDSFFSSPQGYLKCKARCKKCFKIKGPRQGAGIVPKKKPCGSCGTIKPLAEFDSNQAGYGGRSSKCKECHAGGIRHRKYGMSQAAYRAMVEQQEGRCAICMSIPKRKLYVDHDHATGKVRALLCHACNAGLGNFNDSAWVLRAAARYLNSHK